MGFTLFTGIIGFFVSFLVTFIGVSWWINVGSKLGFMSRDMNKPGEVYAVNAGGVWVSVGASFGVLTIIAFHRHVFNEDFYLAEYMALSLLLFMASFLGFLDDILGWKKGLRVWQRVIFMAPLALPLVVIKAGVTTVAIPFLGRVDLGLLYPLVLVPIGVLGASNAYNMLAGYNGLEATLGIILFSSAAIYAYMKGITVAVSVSLVMLAALIAFLLYNKYPAKVFPGNSMTYGVGAYYASTVILGNFEKFGVFLFTLYFIEFLLFIRGLKNHVYKENFGKPRPDGTLDEPYDKVYSLTHLAIKIQKKIRGKATEKGVVATISIMQLIVAILAFLIAPIV
ncbi:glycosyl transferase family 4 [Desulfurococcaceae archaeon MEX13E-LK6-19]|nr:glycosyl transferase family 4 [Desulfurococcaceae archaeon MEX13E-LK6-19]